MKRVRNRLPENPTANLEPRVLLDSAAKSDTADAKFTSSSSIEDSSQGESPSSETETVVIAEQANLDSSSTLHLGSSSALKKITTKAKAKMFDIVDKFKELTQARAPSLLGLFTEGEPSKGKTPKEETSKEETSETSASESELTESETPAATPVESSGRTEVANLLILKNNNRPEDLESAPELIELPASATASLQALHDESEVEGVEFAAAYAVTDDNELSELPLQILSQSPQSVSHTVPAGTEVTAHTHPTTDFDRTETFNGDKAPPEIGATRSGPEVGPHSNADLLSAVRRGNPSIVQDGEQYTYLFLPLDRAPFAPLPPEGDAEATAEFLAALDEIGDQAARRYINTKVSASESYTFNEIWEVRFAARAAAIGGAAYGGRSGELDNGGTGMVRLNPLRDTPVIGDIVI